jgi:hypothetical protein
MKFEIINSTHHKQRHKTSREIILFSLLYIIVFGNKTERLSSYLADYNINICGFYLIKESAMLTRFDRIVSIVLMGLPVPIILMLSGWWGLIPFHPASNSLYFILASAGFLIGVILDATLLGRFLLRLFSLPLPALCALLLFYSIMIYGFFMGFPAFNIIPGILGGYIAIKTSLYKGDCIISARRATRRMDVFSFILLFLLCVSTALLALREPTIQSQLKSMFALPFNVTQTMIWASILAGSALLLALQVLFSRLAQRHVCGKYAA